MIREIAAVRQARHSKKSDSLECFAELAATCDSCSGKKRRASGLTAPGKERMSASGPVPGGVRSRGGASRDLPEALVGTLLLCV